MMVDSRPIIGDRVSMWNNGSVVKGTLYDVRRTIFKKIQYIVAVVVPNGFDPDGIGREKYKYLTFSEDCLISIDKD